ncbi:MAG: polyhydroxyalkanoic acid system family protein [Deltaproteobacteria bacterium]|nr:polyhydroxyalkanoic acid system family protein [Deltaproteobacteria bacterium]
MTVDFPQAEALERLQALTEYWVAKHGLSASWTGSEGQVSGRVKGVKFSGVIKVAEGRVTADVKAGFLAEKLGGRKYVEAKFADYLDPKHSVAELRARIP